MSKELRDTGKEILKGSEMEKIQEIDLTDINKRYIGDFTFVRPSVMQMMRIGIVKAGLAKGIDERALDIRTQNILHMAATLTVVCPKYPEWFDLDKLTDYIVLETVYDAYMEWDSTFRLKSE